MSFHSILLTQWIFIENVNVTTEDSVMFLSHMKSVYTISTITRNSSVTKFVQFKIATNKKYKQVNLKNKPKLRFDMSSKKKTQNIWITKKCKKITYHKNKKKYKEKKTSTYHRWWWASIKQWVKKWGMYRWAGKARTQVKEESSNNGYKPEGKAF